MNVGLAERSKRQEQNVAVDAAKPCHFGAAAVAAATDAGAVLPSLRHNLLYWCEKIDAHHA